MDERGRQVEGEMGIGPFKEGDSITLECHVPGGKLTCFIFLKYLLFQINLEHLVCVDSRQRSLGI